MDNLIQEFKNQLKIELKACGTGIFPQICKMNETDRGFEEIFKNVYKIVSETGMSIGSALAQYESSL